MIKTINKDPIRLWLSVILIAFMALWIRINYFHYTDVNIPIRGDAAHYVQYAFNLVNHGVYSKSRNTDTPTPDAYWAPGYPAFIATAMIMEKNFGTDTYRTIIYAQACIGALIAILTLLLGRQFLPHCWAFFAATLVVFSPHLVSLGNYVLTETLFSLFFLASIYIFVLAFFKKNNWLFALSGLLFGASYLVNPVAFFTPLIFTGIAVFLYQKMPEISLSSAIKILVPCLLTFSLCVGGWAIRGTVNVPQDSASSSTRLLTNLIIGSHHNFHSMWRENPRNPSNPATIDEANLQGSYSAFAQLLTERVADNPLHYAHWYFIQKPIMLWDWNILVGQGDIYVYPVNYSLYHTSKPAIFTYSVMRASHYWLFGCALLGLIFLAVNLKENDKKTTVSLFIYSAVIYVSAVYVISQAEARYSVPLRPLMYLGAAYFLSMFVSLAWRNKAASTKNPSHSSSEQVNG